MKRQGTEAGEQKCRHGDLTEKIIGAAFDVHRELGYGFAEKVYENALAVRLAEVGVRAAQQQPVRVEYHGQTVGEYVADLIVEVKAVKNIAPEHEVQLVNYLKATDLEVGLLLNFAVSVDVKRRIMER